MQKAAVFLDRDGTIIEDLHYPRHPEKVVLLPDAIAGLTLMTAKGYLLFVVSNQSGVGRGIISDAEFSAVHSKVCELLRGRVEIAEFLYCFHRPEDGCDCRKPKAALIPKIYEGSPLAWNRSFTVGDKDCDLLLAKTIGAKPFLVTTGKGRATSATLKSHPLGIDFQEFDTLLEVAEQLPRAPHS